MRVIRTYSRRMRKPLLVSAVVAAAIATAAPSGAAAAPTPNPAPASTPLAHTHAHNDYLHAHPLFDALSHRFLSVEADIWLTDDGQLLVGHDKNTLKKGDTLEALYLDPLTALVNSNADHAVYAGSSASVQLLIDVKSDATATYRALDQKLRDHYASILTHWTSAGVSPGAVTVVISGNRDRALMLSQPDRYAAYDGRLSDLGDGTPAGFMPLVSDTWANAVPKWKGAGPMPATDRARLRSLVAQAHAEGRQVRFYATPDSSFSQQADVWQEELDAGVDWLNTDELGVLENFLAP
jgi:glycerophosphoryl diester phosphodiesterase